MNARNRRALRGGSCDALHLGRLLCVLLLFSPGSRHVRQLFSLSGNILLQGPLMTRCSRFFFCEEQGGRVIYLRGRVTRYGNRAVRFLVGRASRMLIEQLVPPAIIALGYKLPMYLM